MSENARLRASDADRERAAESLREHYAAGRISEEELGERLEAVYAARTVEELTELRDDLPELPLSPGARRQELAAHRAELRGRMLQRAGGTFAPFVICTVVWAAAGAQGSFWPAFLLIAPVLFIGRNLWRLYGPEPEIDRVRRELDRPDGGHRRRHHRAGVHDHRRGLG
jgi:hypothetical protein